MENFSKINKRGGGRLFGTREYQLLEDLRDESQDVIDWLKQNNIRLNVTKSEFSKQLGKISEIGGFREKLWISFHRAHKSLNSGLCDTREDGHNTAS